jgi:hypothetical protein
MEIAMRLHFFSAITLILLLASAQNASATILTYDDFGYFEYVSPAGFDELGYQFSNNMDVVNVSSFLRGGGVSGMYAALNNYGGDAVITQVGGGQFSFIDTYASGWNTNGVFLTFSGYLNGALVGTITTTVLGPDMSAAWVMPHWSLIDTNFSDVDEVVISGYGGVFLLDNTEVGAPVSVPTPIAGAGLPGMVTVIGVMGLIGRRRRGQNATQ